MKTIEVDAAEMRRALAKQPRRAKKPHTPAAERVAHGDGDRAKSADTLAQHGFCLYECVCDGDSKRHWFANVRTDEQAPVGRTRSEAIDLALAYVKERK